MYGDKARIGALIPSYNMGIEPEFNAMVPRGVSVHVTRLPIQTMEIEDFKHMAEGVQVAAKLLTGTRVNIIAYVCTIGSLIRGIGESALSLGMKCRPIDYQGHRLK